MDLEYVMSRYPDVHPAFLLMTMIDIRDNGWPQNKNIIEWFNCRLIGFILFNQERKKVRAQYNKEKRSNLYKNIDFRIKSSKSRGCVKNSKNQFWSNCGQNQ